ncbi:MAG: hypothetical protein ABS42_00165 [Bdellovibrio sp. SCN 50-8]|nr:MAG: hypothetical protein ABS42_00165 [Bdellovibrio sp. SCN 50-8]
MKVKITYIFVSIVLSLSGFSASASDQSGYDNMKEKVTQFGHKISDQISGACANLLRVSGPFVSSYMGAVDKVTTSLVRHFKTPAEWNRDTIQDQHIAYLARRFDGRLVEESAAVESMEIDPRLDDEVRFFREVYAPLKVERLREAAYLYSKSETFSMYPANSVLILENGLVAKFFVSKEPVLKEEPVKKNRGAG